jgi:hypothetical protein
VNSVDKKSFNWALVVTDLQYVRGLGELSKIRVLFHCATAASVVREAFMVGNDWFQRQEGEFWLKPEFAYFFVCVFLCVGENSTLS